MFLELNVKIRHQGFLCGSKSCFHGQIIDSIIEESQKESDGGGLLLAAEGGGASTAAPSDEAWSLGEPITGGLGEGGGSVKAPPPDITSTLVQEQIDSEAQHEETRVAGAEAADRGLAGPLPVEPDIVASTKRLPPPKVAPLSGSRPPKPPPPSLPATLLLKPTPDSARSPGLEGVAIRTFIRLLSCYL